VSSLSSLCALMREIKTGVLFSIAWMRIRVLEEIS